MPTTILVTGAANGLGAAFVEAYRHQDQTQVFAIDREQISCPHENVKSWAVDVTDESSIDSFVRDIKDQPIDLVLHSAGIRGLVPHLEQEKHGDVDACETMEAMDFATLTQTFNINAAGTFMLFRAIMSNLLKAKDPKVIVMSSRMGSLGN
ncbi:hypothetical protein KC318_g21698, partial [Hortaea werneckii]